MLLLLLSAASTRPSYSYVRGTYGGGGGGGASAAAAVEGGDDEEEEEHERDVDAEGGDEDGGDNGDSYYARRQHLRNVCMSLNNRRRCAEVGVESGGDVCCRWIENEGCVRAVAKRCNGAADGGDTSSSPLGGTEIGEQGGEEEEGGDGGGTDPDGGGAVTFPPGTGRPPLNPNCPEPPEGSFGICLEECYDDASCVESGAGPNSMCCSNGCGHVCV